MEEHKVSETRIRSLLKTVSLRVLEVTADTAIIGVALELLGVPHAYATSFILAVVTEILCALVTYLNERLWNRIQWGRKVEHVREH